MPKVSVVVPVYNAEKYLSRCITSILDQTYKDFELILVNDGSSDSSLQIIEAYLQADERVIMFTQSNSGVSVARMKGVSLARGTWVTFVDADDILFINALEIMIKNASLADLVNASMISTNGYVWEQKRVGIIGRDEYIRCLLDSTIFGVPVAKLFKREMLTPDVFDFPSDIKIGEDVLMNLKVAQKVTIVNSISDKIYSYCNNEQSTMGTYSRSVLYFLRYFQLRDSIIDDHLRQYSMPFDIDIIIKSFYDDNIPFRRVYAKKLRYYLADAMRNNSIVDLNLKKKINDFLSSSGLKLFFKKNAYYYKMCLLNVVRGYRRRKVLD